MMQTFSFQLTLNSIERSFKGHVKLFRQFCMAFFSKITSDTRKKQVLGNLNDRVIYCQRKFC